MYVRVPKCVRIGVRLHRPSESSPPCPAPSASFHPLKGHPPLPVGSAGAATEYERYRELKSLLRELEGGAPDS